MFLLMGTLILLSILILLIVVKTTNYTEHSVTLLPHIPVGAAAADSKAHTDMPVPPRCSESHSGVPFLSDSCVYIYIKDEKDKYVANPVVLKLSPPS